MFVRWQRKQRADLDRWGPLLCAVLVESRRVNGKPRQRTVAYLGSIREGFIGRTLSRHAYFWEHVTARLDGLGDRLVPEERGKIEAALAKKIRLLTDAERADVNKMLAGYKVARRV